MKETLCDYCKDNGDIVLLKQWHPERNDDLTPEAVAVYSHRKVWWKCEKGHEWQARVYSRMRGTGCPYCAGKHVISGENDLRSLYPEIANQ